MDNITIRKFERIPKDYQGVVNIQNTVYPDMPGAVENYMDKDERRDPKCKHQRWVAVHEKRIVGATNYDQSLWEYHPQKFFMGGGVLPDYQGQGIGSALYDALLAGLQPFDPIEIRVNARDDFPQSIRFLEKRGFAEHMRSGESHLDVTAFDPSPYAGLEDKLRAQGIEIKTLRELESDPARNRKLYEMEWELEQDVPGSEDITQVEFEKWLDDLIHHPLLLPDGYIVAVHGDRYIGMSNLWDDRASESLYTGLTAVRREYRRKGIASAMKVRAIAFARENGNLLIKTSNEVNNRSMLSINERLGFVRQPDWITFKKNIKEEEATNNG